MRTACSAALRGLALAVALALGGPAEAQRPQPASPPTKAACGKAYVDGQHLRAAHMLLEARRALAVCAVESCPQAVRPDCGQWLSEVNRDIPTIAVHALDASGADVADVRISVDGEVVADKLAGLPIELDPGAHMLRFDRADAPPIMQSVVAVLGEKLRPVSVRFAAPQVAAAAQPEPPVPARPVPLATWVLGATGVVAGAVTAGLWASAQSQYSSLKASCAPKCNPSQADSTRTEMIAGDVTVVVGSAALVAAAVFYFLRPSHEADGGNGGARLDVTLSARGAAVGTRWAF